MFEPPPHPTSIEVEPAEPLSPELVAHYSRLLDFAKAGDVGGFYEYTLREDVARSPFVDECFAACHRQHGYDMLVGAEHLLDTATVDNDGTYARNDVFKRVVEARSSFAYGKLAKPRHIKRQLKRFGKKDTWFHDRSCIEKARAAWELQHPHVRHKVEDSIG